MFASSHRFSLYDGFFADFAAALGFPDPVAFAYILLMVWFLIGQLSYASLHAGLRGSPGVRPALLHGRFPWRPVSSRRFAVFLGV